MVAQHRRSLTLADVVAVGLILWSAAYTTVLLARADGETLFALCVVATLAVLALRGMYVFKTAGSSVTLWCAIGAHIGLGMLFIFSIGLGVLFNAAVLILYAIFRSRHAGLPVVDRWGLLAEVAGFAVAPAILLALW